MRDSRLPKRIAGRRTLMLLALPLALGACDGLFDVDNPVDILEEDLDDPRVVSALANSAEAAVSNGYDIAVQYGELAADGAIHISTNQGNLALDVGILDEYNERSEAVFNEMSSARWTAAEVTRRLEALVEDPASHAAVGRSYFWQAIARITLADVTEEVPFDGEAPMTPVQVYESTIPILQTAADISAAAGETQYVAASYGTLARLYRSLYFESGESLATFALARDAAQKALAADPNYSLSIRYQSPASNGLESAWLVGTFYDVMDPAYANQRDPASGQIDARIQHAPFSGLISTFGDSVYQQTKYDGRDDDIRVSSWQEAELILAEYHLLAGNPGQAVVHINRVREAAGLPAFSGTGAAAVRAQLLYERKTEFWLELRRWQDMRYYDIIPERWNPAQQQAGVDRRFPVSLRERTSNPFYTGG